MHHSLPPDYRYNVTSLEPGPPSLLYTMICESESTIFFFLNLFSQAFVTVTENIEKTLQGVRAGISIFEDRKHCGSSTVLSVGSLSELTLYRF